ncbi:MAG: PEP/pyruvate-binding domain-containing protein [Desulfonatronovibrionaceae bacterium]
MERHRDTAYKPQPDTDGGMVRVRTICARVSLEVWKIVDSMRRLAPGKYQDLDTRLARIRAGIEILLQPAHSRGAGPLVVDLGQVGLKDRHLLGSKLAMLGEVNSKLGLDTPPGFAVTSAGFWRFMDENELGEGIERRIRAAAPSGLDDWHALSSDLQALIMNTSLPSDLEEEFRAAASRYFPPLAVRSSALSEDDPGASFAGLHRSILNVGTKDLIPAFKEVVASLFSPAAMAYRFHMGIPDQDAVMCTGCLEMVQARTGGVLYTRDPLGQNPGAVLNSVWGLPKPVVEERCRGDLFKFSEGGRIDHPAVSDRSRFPPFPGP